MHSEETADAWVVLGGIHLLNQTAPRRPGDVIALVHVPRQEQRIPSNTVVIDWRTLGLCRVDALTADGQRLGAVRIDGGALFPEAIAGPALRGLVGDDAAPDLVPLCYLSEHSAGGYHAYAQILLGPRDACFIRSTLEPVGRGPVDALNWLGPVLDAHAAAGRALNNHRRYYRTYFAGTELEYKYNLEPVPDVWVAARELLKDLRDGELPGYRPEYGDDFQANLTDNHLFDVLGPDEEVGYASFVATVSAGYVLKRKWYAEDAFARREELFAGIDVTPNGFEDYLTSKLGLRVRAMPPFRRVRYDVHCESLETGHVYGIFFDHCSLIVAPDVVLSQCELEYRRSRTVLDGDGQEVMGEMEHIADWLQQRLADRGWSRERTFYSKRTFLRDAVASRPELVT